MNRVRVIHFQRRSSTPLSEQVSHEGLGHGLRQICDFGGVHGSLLDMHATREQLC